MYRFILASGNKHKVEELNELLKISGATICSPEKSLSIEENGSSFYENAYLKAKGYFDQFKRPTVSDDSGLVVDALPEELGIHSARFGGEGLDDSERHELLLKKLVDVPVEKRSAKFVCVLCFFLSPNEVFYFEGNLSGSISLEAKGNKGFGYDPVFIPKGQERTLAEIPDWKRLNSHRANSCKSANTFFKNFFS